MHEVYRHLKRYGFTGLRDIKFEVSLSRLQNFFNLSATEAALFTYIFVNYYDFGEKPVSIGILASDAGVSSLRFLGFQNEIDELEKKGFIYTDTIEDPTMLAKFYRINEGITKAVINNDISLITEGLRKKERDLTYPDNIKEKNLFYPDKIKDDIKSLETYLEKSHFETIQSRLEEKRMPKGICIMLHGHSGTGKTETVFQIARKTGRAILHIDIGATISMWHGGTEKNLSILFDRYSRLCKDSKKKDDNIPILLFNEADALFGHRMERPTQGSEIDENHIQSVLLDYLEKQEGIVIATTNLAGSFDTAFERRFLFKIKFEKPDLEIKKKIWKDKASWLKAPAVSYLAENYNLTGAEIENVMRKATMKEVLTGNRSTLKEIENFCEKEKLESDKRKQIGFNR